jgi:hypothetical protein
MWLVVDFREVELGLVREGLDLWFGMRACVYDVGRAQRSLLSRQWTACVRESVQG